MTDRPFADEIQRFFAAMQGGISHESAMMSLFAEDATYTEPFGGTPRTHNGRAQITAVMRASLSQPLPDMRIVVERIDATGSSAKVAWTCHSPALPGGRGSGVNVFTFRDGKITRLETTLDAIEARR